MTAKHSTAKKRVIDAYSSLVIRAYCTLRFRIMNMRILEEIGQYLPATGRILDVACGFGLFSLYYGMMSSERCLQAVDIDKHRIEMAMSAADRLGLSARVAFQVQDVSQITASSGTFAAAYMLDIIHHLPAAHHEPLLATIHDALAPGGVLIVKDIATRPWWKRLFTWLLDMAMSPGSPPHYVDTSALKELLTNVGFDVKIHALLDVLPYPHVLYICRKDGHQP